MTDARFFRASSPLVSLRRCVDYDPVRVAQSVSVLLESLGGIGAFVRCGDRVLLKPNLIVPRGSEAAVTTHPEVIRAVAREVLDAGGRPFIADSPAFSSARAVAEKGGIGDVALDLGIEIRDLARRPRVCRVGEDSPFPRVPLSALALDADVIINLPKIKTHVQMGMSLGVKNLFGAVSGKRKAVFHFRNGEDPVRFGRLLVAIARYLKPALTIADGIVVLERHGPTTGDPRPGEFLAASGDPVAVDRVVLDLVGVDPATVPYMEAARQMGYGCQDLDRIEVLGDAIADLRLTDYVQVARFSPINFTLPRVVKSVVRQVFYLVSARAEAWRGRG